MTNRAKGKERNKTKLVYEVGVCDASTVNEDGSRRREYTLWKGILRRVYARNTEKDRQKHKTYENVTVCERWLTFSNFLEDLPEIEGYNEWLKGEVRMSLDKDLKQQGVVENKIYSLETCVFISQGDNARISRIRPMIAIDVNDYNNKKIHHNVNEEFGQSTSNISACAKGHQQSAYGQRWFYADEYELMTKAIDDKFQELEDSKVALSWSELQQLYRLINSANFHKLNSELDKCVKSV